MHDDDLSWFSTKKITEDLGYNQSTVLKDAYEKYKLIEKLLMDN